ncbi:MAG: serine/threonine protein kinase, partial [Deltaproteobacteria bacterium]|nr:serine/threonine protein kinase [Kofleriaceae bacterium]
MYPGESIGKYLLVRALGEGGMKQVWRARDTERGQDVALAVVHQFDPAAFSNEVALAFRVTSAHVARVLDGFVTEHGVAVVVSELCDGLDLLHYRQARAVTPGEAVAMVAQMATGIAAIHAAHVLHRDVKPSNAILTAAGVKMIDFGVSLPAIDARTGVGGFAPPAGTLPYMAPEAATGEVDARLDTYALGVSLYELVVGRLPLPRLGFHAWMDRLVRAEPLPGDELAR